MNSKQKEDTIFQKLQAVLLNVCNSIISFILKNLQNERPSISQIRQQVYQSIVINPNINEAQEQQQGTSLNLQKSQEELNEYYNSRDLEIDITRINEVENECLNSLDNIESLCKLGEINTFYHRNLERAYQYFIQAIAINSKDPEPYIGLGFICREKTNSGDQNCLQEMKKYAEIAENIYPRYWRLYFLKNYIFNAENNVQQANLQLKQALQIKKFNSTLITRNQTFEVQNKNKQIEKKKFLLEIEQMQFKCKYRLYYFNLGFISDIAEEYQKAIYYYTKQLQYFPKDYVAIGNIGQAYYNLKQFDKAEREFQKALKICPNFQYSLKGKSRIQNIKNSSQN